MEGRTVSNFTYEERRKMWALGFTDFAIDTIERAVLSDYRKRVRAEALREAADDLPWSGRRLGEILRARADAEEPGNE
jgi:hypothetical protein